MVILIFALIGLAVSAVYVFIANLLDTTIKSKEDIEEKVGLTMLTAIPACDFGRPVSSKGKGGRK